MTSITDELMAYTSFPHFRQLPTEVRSMIWNLSKIRRIDYEQTGWDGATSHQSFDCTCSSYPCVCYWNPCDGDREPQLCDEESPADYQLGGYHPVHLDDTLDNGRYRVLSKLGWGSSSMVWLCKDTHASKFTRLVAIKILVARMPKGQNALLRTMLDSACESTFPALQHHFYHTGPNGTHECLVMDFVGPNIDVWQQEEVRFFDKNDAQRETYFDLEHYTRDYEVTNRLIIRQLIDNLQMLHRKDYVFGALQGKHILIYLQEAVNEASFYAEDGILSRMYSESIPKRYFVKRRDGSPLSAGTPSYILESPRWPDLEGISEVDSLMKVAIRLTCHLPCANRSTGMINPRPLENFCEIFRFEAPETLLAGQTVSKSTDLWHLGLMMFQVLFADHPFYSLSNNYHGRKLPICSVCHLQPTRRDLIAQWLRFTGEDIPEAWKSAYAEILARKEPPDKCNAKGRHELCEQHKLQCLEQGFGKNYSLQERFFSFIDGPPQYPHASEKYQAVIRGLVKFMPEDRLSLVDLQKLELSGHLDENWDEYDPEDGVFGYNRWRACPRDQILFDSWYTDQYRGT